MSHDLEELAMQSISIIGLDIGKSVFQVHGVDAVGQVTVRQWRRAVRPLDVVGTVRERSNVDEMQ